MGLHICSKVAAFAGISLKFEHTSDPYSRVSDADTQHRYSWLHCSFSGRVLPGLCLKFWHNWDLQSSRKWGSWICMKPTLASCGSLWMYHSGPETPWKQQICHQSVCIPIFSKQYIVVSIILVMFSSTLNMWTQCTQIAIYQDTLDYSAGEVAHSTQPLLVCQAMRDWDIEGRH